MKKIAIVGGGVVGATAAFYLSKNKGIELTMYDDGNLQASSAAVGIVAPWLSQRRNKYWYNLVRDGAEFYDKLIADVGCNQFYEKIGGLYINERMEDKIYQLAKMRQQETYKIGDVEKVTSDQKGLAPVGFKWKTGVYISGAARVDGKKMVKVLLDQAVDQGMNYCSEWANIQVEKDKYRVNGSLYDELILAAGAWLKEALDFLPNYTVDVFKQKGQLIEFEMMSDKKYPVIMPKGEIDYLFDGEGNLVIGASHENEYLDEKVDWSVLYDLQASAMTYYPELKNKRISSYRLGLRAHSSDYTPFYGPIDLKGLYVASGLGSSGLTSGPIIGYRLAQLVQDKDAIDDEWFNAKDYVFLNK